MTRQDAIGALLGRLRDWWRRQEELRSLSDKQVGLIAADLRISIGTLKDLIARGPNTTKLFYERMRTLGITKADVDRAAHGAMCDMQRTCACCKEKGVCDWDLAERPHDPVWKSYCPNANALDFINKLKAHSFFRMAQRRPAERADHEYCNKQIRGLQRFVTDAAAHLHGTSRLKPRQ
jgi:hypothetical protein